jgi:hypothetical protein
MTTSQKIAQKKYQNSLKGVAARKRTQMRYEASPKGKMRRRNYLKSSKGKESIMASRRMRSLMKRTISNTNNTIYM